MLGTAVVENIIKGGLKKVFQSAKDEKSDALPFYVLPENTKEMLK